MSLSRILKEELNKTDKKEIESIVQDILDDFESDMNDEMRKMIEDTDTEDMIRDYIQDSLEQYHKVLWQRRSNWSGAI